MALKVRKQLIMNLANTSGTGNPRTYLTIHQTDNWSKGANAAAHANLQSRKGSAATWHWQVDDREAVQSYAENVKCWHAGDGAGKGNMASIAIEFCVNADGDYDKTFDNAAQLAAQIMKRNNIPLSRMVQHNHWSGKNCPSMIRDRGEWQKFVDLVSQYLDGAAAPTLPASSSGKLTVDGYWGAGTTRALQKVLGTPVDGVVSSQAGAWKTKNPGLTSGWEWTSKPRGSRLIIAMQKKLGVTADGLIGPATINALSKRYGVKGDGKLDAGSITVKAMQRKLNEGKF